MERIFQLCAETHHKVVSIVCLVSGRWIFDGLLWQLSARQGLTRCPILDTTVSRSSVLGWSLVYPSHHGMLRGVSIFLVLSAQEDTGRNLHLAVLLLHAGSVDVHTKRRKIFPSAIVCSCAALVSPWHGACSLLGICNYLPLLPRLLCSRMLIESHRAVCCKVYREASRTSRLRCESSRLDYLLVVRISNGPCRTCTISSILGDEPRA
mmetsp:Transcript_79807/g.150752  ORF Transcript_79807/g.150752 Transcript_79807/m.150752 type:complete len:208 (+) Transcript_79807:431-1054(+)